MNRDSDQELTLAVGRLQIAHGRLRAINPKALTEEERQERSAALKELRKLIDELTRRRLSQISDEMVGNASDLGTATSELEHELAGLERAIQIIRVIAGGVRVITNLIGLTTPVKKKPK